MVNNHKAAFIKLFNETARNRHRYEVFRDFVTMASISLHNALFKAEKLESEYLQTASKYSDKDLSRICELFSLVVLGLEEPCDFLGSVFMELELGEKRAGQFFTPFHVSELMAKLTFDPSSSDLKSRGFITLSEPAVGGGGMIIAFAKAMLENGFNPQKQLWVQAIDVDPVAAYMCYLQLSLLHIPAEVVVGNTLSLEVSKVMRTPAHYLGLWTSKLKGDSYEESFKTEGIETVIPVPEEAIKTSSLKQLSLFGDVA